MSRGVRDRPADAFGEVANNLRSAEYEFMLGEIRVKTNGKGEGKLVPHAKITYDRERQMIEIEDYASQPVRLTQVRASKGES